MSRRVGHPLSWYRPGREVVARDPMDRGAGGRVRPYRYVLTAAAGDLADGDAGFAPALSPAEMLAAGVFEGKYLNDLASELPAEWFAESAARRVAVGEPADPSLNAFGVKSRLSLAAWRAKGWAPLRYEPGECRGCAAGAPRAGARSYLHRGGCRGRQAGDRDVRGWFQWYCRYWLGRRVPGLDEAQIARWRSFAARHGAQVRAASLAAFGRRPTRAEARAHHPRHRQALLQWACDPYV